VRGAGHRASIPPRRRHPPSVHEHAAAGPLVLYLVRARAPVDMRVTSKLLLREITPKKQFSFLFLFFLKKEFILICYADTLCVRTYIKI
jgi:hypothetical protein